MHKGYIPLTDLRQQRKRKWITSLTDLIVGSDARAVLRLRALRAALERVRTIVDLVRKREKLRRSLSLHAADELEKASTSGRARAAAAANAVSALFCEQGRIAPGLDARLPGAGVLDEAMRALSDSS